MKPKDLWLQMKAKEETLTHFGILGMKWGFRKGKKSSGARTAGSPDHEKKIVLKGKKLKDMSNTEIQEFTKRLQLESAYRKATAKPKSKIRQIAEGMVKELGDEALKTAKAKAGAAILKQAMKLRAR